MPVRLARSRWREFRCRTANSGWWREGIARANRRLSGNRTEPYSEMDPVRASSDGGAIDATHKTDGKRKARDPIRSKPISRETPRFAG
jgi:hypothetical protein